MFNYDDVVSAKGVASLEAVHGIQGLLKILKTNERTGINTDDILLVEREAAFGKNFHIAKPLKSFCALVWEQLQDFILKILILAAMISLVIGIIEEPADGWMEGAAILIAVTLVVMVTAVNDYLKQKQFAKLNAVTE
jgi:magnesium-transporting ATPase (P-type)